MPSNKYKILFLLLALPIMLFSPREMKAWQKETIPGMPVSNDFTLGPAKVEVWLDPGASASKTLTITNRLGHEVKFILQLEDFTGSPDGGSAAVLLGGQRGPYSLRDYLQPEVMEFTLQHGERASIPVAISLPSDLKAGGLYGSVLVSTANLSDASGNPDQVSGQIQAIARLGCLFFIRVRGEAQESGRLDGFSTLGGKSFYQAGPVDFSVYYRNEGNVHLNPYGLIIIRNILGKEIAALKVDPYFAMPQSLRYVEKKWEKQIGLGLYRATLSLNRGYGDIIDTKTINFYILPWKIILLGIAIMAALIVLFWWLANNLEIKSKT